MFGAALIGRRGVLLFAVALAALAAVPATAHSQSAATGPSQKLGGWALEVTPKFAASIRPRLMAGAKKHGLNTLVLDRQLSREQERRVRSVAHRFDLRVIQLRRVVCKSEVATCAVVARSPAAIRRLSREPRVDIVVVRLRRPALAPRLTRKYMRAASGTTRAQLMLLPRLRPRFSRASWRKAISAVADAQTVDLGVTPSGHSSTGAFRLFFDLLASPSPASPPSTPPSPAPPPSPPAEGRSGSVIFSGAFESGTLAPWPGAQCANTGVPSSGDRVTGTLTVQSETVGEGDYGARFDLPAATVVQSCEALIGRPIGVGTDDYYALMVRFPTEWREPSPVGWGLAIAQLNFENIWGSPVALMAHADRVALVMQSGLCNSVYTASPGCAYSSGRGGNVERTYAVPAPLALNVWHELIVHVRWATDSSGVLEAWHRLKGDNTWNKTVSLTGYPTLQWTADYGPSAIASGTTFDTIGAYRGPATFPLTIWHDGFVRATSFASAASALP